MFAEVHRFYRLARLLVTTCGKNALKGSLPLYLTLAITVFVLFAGNGLDARTITSLGVERPVFRWCLGLAWVLASLPAARALLSSSETFFLRALPVPRAELLLLFGAALAIVHLPWTVLWARGAGAGPALGATLGVLAIQMHVLAGARTRVDGLTLAVGIAAFALAPSLLTAALGVGSFVAGLGQAWSRAPESQPFGSHCVSTRSRPLALMSALAISVVRGQRPVVVRAFLLALTACVLNVLGLRNNGVSEPGAIIRISLVVWGPACVFGAVATGGGVLKVEGKARWVLDVCGVSRALRCSCAAALLAGWSAACGLVYGVLVGQISGLDAPLAVLLALHTASAGAAWGAASIAIVRWATHSGGRDAGRLLLAVCCLFVLSAALLVLQTSAAVGLLLMVAAALSALSARVRWGAERPSLGGWRSC